MPRVAFGVSHPFVAIVRPSVGVPNTDSAAILKPLQDSPAVANPSVEADAVDMPEEDHKQMAKSQSIARLISEAERE